MNVVVPRAAKCNVRVTRRVEIWFRLKYSGGTRLCSFASSYAFF